MCRSRHLPPSKHSAATLTAHGAPLLRLLLVAFMTGCWQGTLPRLPIARRRFCRTNFLPTTASQMLGSCTRALLSSRLFLC